MEPKRVGTGGRVTLAKIAKAAGVSAGAVSSLINNKDYGTIKVSSKTKARILKTCRDYGYRPDDPRSFVRIYPERGDICLLSPAGVLSSCSHPYFSRVAVGASSVIDGASLSLATYQPAHDYATDPDRLPSSIRFGTASRFLCAGEPNQTLIEAILKISAPLAYLNRYVDHRGVISIVPDYEQAARTAITHLHKLGHRRIGIIAGPFGSTEYNISELNRGIRIGMNDVGLSISPGQVAYGDMTADAGSEAMGHFLEQAERPTAVFCFSDAIATGALMRATLAGISIPRDLSILGCGNDACCRTHCSMLTTIHLPIEDLGSIAVKMLNERMGKALGKALEPEKITIPVEVVERISCGPVHG